MPLAALRPWASTELRPWAGNPRTEFPEAEIAALADSIAARGVLQNLVARRGFDGVGFEILAGERRYRALTVLAADGRWDMDEAAVPVRLVDAEDRDALLLALTENLQREDVPALDEARAYLRLRDDLRLGTDEIAERLGITRRTVQLRIALVEQLDPKVLEALGKGEISLQQAREAATAPAALQKALLPKMKDGRLGRGQDVRAAVKGDLVPVERAIFPTDGLEAEIVELADGTRHFADKEAFMGRQRAAAEAKAAELAKTLPWAEVKAGYRPAEHLEYSGYEPTDDPALAGALVCFDQYEGTVEIVEGLAKPADDDEEEHDEEAWERKQAEDTRLRKERETAATELGRKLAKALAANPSVCWRVLIMALAESRSYEDRCGYSHYNARRKSAGQWREKLAPHMSQVKGTGLEIVDGADLGALWRDLAALDPAEPAKLLAALVADRVTVQSWRLGASTIAMAEELGLEVPAILLPEPEDEEDEEDGQTDLEDAIGERRSPDDMIDQAEAEAMSGA